MGKILDAFWLIALCMITGFIFLWGALAVIEGAVCFGCILAGLAGFFTRTVLVPFFKGEDGGLV